MKMKNILKLSLISFAAISMIACEDSRETNMVEDGFLLSTATNMDNITSVSVYDGSYSLSVFKSGKGKTSGSVSVALDESLVEWYNEKHETSFKMVPTNTVRLSKEIFDFNSTDATKQLAIFWDPKAVSDEIESGDEDTYVIPVKITGGDLEVWEGTDYALIQLVKTSVKFTSVKQIERVASFKSTYKDVQKASVALSNPSSAMTSVAFMLDGSLVDAYNEANGTNYTLAPSKLITLPMRAEIAAGSTSAEFEYTINSAAYFEHFGTNPDDFKPVLAPIRILSSSNDGIDTNIGEDNVFYVIVTAPTVPQASISTTTIERMPLSGSTYVENIKGKFEFSVPVLGIDCQVHAEIDNSLIPAFNAEHGTSHMVAPEGLVYIPESFSMPENRTEAEFTLKLDRSKVPADFSSYLVPVKATGLQIDEQVYPIENQVCYIVLTPAKHRTLMGPWPILEGGEGQAIGDGDTVDGKDGSWYTEHYTAQGLCDGHDGIGLSYPEGHVWGAWFDTPMELPLEFVFDMGEAHCFTKIWKFEFSSFQGSWNHIQVYLSEEYGKDAKWQMAYDGELGAKGWESSTGEKHSDDVQNTQVTGRYLKLVFVEPSGMYYSNSSSHMAGYIREIWFEGY